MEKLLSPPVVDTALYSNIYQAKGLQAVQGSPVRPVEMLRSDRLSNAAGAEIWLASEVGQTTGAYKIRGAYNFMSRFDFGGAEVPMVTASAGNHASAVALCARAIGRRAVIYMPENTPVNKVEQTKELGGEYVHVRLRGRTFDDSYELAREHEQSRSLPFIHPFDDDLVIAGQGTLGVEIADFFKSGVDTVYCPVGGGGLLSGIGTVIRLTNPEAELVGVEPSGAASLKYAFDHDAAAPLPYEIDTFVDGAAVKQVGEKTFGYLKSLQVRPKTVTNKSLRGAVTGLWKQEKKPVPCELAGGLSVAAATEELGSLAGKTVVCVVSGGNLSRDRYNEEVRLS